MFKDYNNTIDAVLVNLYRNCPKLQTFYVKDGYVDIIDIATWERTKTGFKKQCNK